MANREAIPHDPNKPCHFGRYGKTPQDPNWLCPLEMKYINDARFRKSCEDMDPPRTQLDCRKMTYLANSAETFAPRPMHDTERHTGRRHFVQPKLMATDEHPTRYGGKSETHNHEDFVTARKAMHARVDEDPIHQAVTMAAVVKIATKHAQEPSHPPANPSALVGEMSSSSNPVENANPSQDPWRPSMMASAASASSWRQAPTWEHDDSAWSASNSPWNSDSWNVDSWNSQRGREPIATHNNQSVPKAYPTHTSSPPPPPPPRRRDERSTWADGSWQFQQWR